jgi:hypothetical protein
MRDRDRRTHLGQIADYQSDEDDACERGGREVVCLLRYQCGTLNGVQNGSRWNIAMVKVEAAASRAEDEEARGRAVGWADCRAMSNALEEMGKRDATPPLPYPPSLLYAALESPGTGVPESIT